MKIKSSKIILLVPVMALLLLSLVFNGCSPGSGEIITFSQLISRTAQYNGRSVTLEAYYFSGFEISALAGSLGPSTFGPWRIVPSGPLVWVKSGITQNIFDKLYTQTDTPAGYPEHLGKLRITGQFETGGQYGHLDAYQYQILITRADLLDWSPPPALAPPGSPAVPDVAKIELIPASQLYDIAPP
jgi:hypothetical protein